MCSIFIKAVESICVEEVDCCRLLCAIESSSFVEAVESVVVEAVDCCRLLYESSKVWCQKCNCRQLFRPNWASSVQCSTRWASHLNRRPKAPRGFK